MKILEVPIDNLSRKEILARAERFLDEPKFHRIVTVNPEFLLEAEKNAAFRETLLNADLRVADGFGIVLAGWLQGKNIKRFAGADLMEEILKIAQTKKLSIFLAVRKDGLSSLEEIRSAIFKKYPNLEIEGIEFDTQMMNYESRIIKFQILNSKFQILFCNFGAPDQELFLANLQNSAGGIRLAMGVGGALDYLTGKLPRAPRALRAIGLEWLWRLVQQPKRLRRIWNATAVFFFKVLKSFLSH